MAEQADSDAVEALAEAWASIDGKLDYFREEREIANGQFATSSIVGRGHYAGYLVEATEMIDRLRARGFGIHRIANPDLDPTVPEERRLRLVK